MGGIVFFNRFSFAYFGILNNLGSIEAQILRCFWLLSLQLSPTTQSSSKNAHKEQGNRGEGGGEREVPKVGSILTVAANVIVDTNTDIGILLALVMQ